MLSSRICVCLLAWLLTGDAGAAEPGADAYWVRPLPAQGTAPADFVEQAKDLSPATCGLCHLKQHQEWSRSLHARAAGPGLLEIGIAKCGFGTECSVMAPESVFMKQERSCGEGVPICTFRMFRSMLPLQGLIAAIVLFNLYILGAWLLGKGSIPNAAGDQGLYWGHILGGPLLAMGAVFMIGCEVRT